MFTVKRFGKNETIISAKLADGTEIGFQAGAKVTWVVWDIEENKPRMIEKLNGKTTIDAFAQKRTAEMQAEFLNG